MLNTKVIRLFYVLVVLGSWTNSVGSAQTQCLLKDEDIGQVQYATALIRDMMSLPKGFHNSVGDKREARLGDRAAIALMRIYSSQQMLESQNLDRIVDVIHGAFSFSCVITVPEDKNPKATLFMLESLQFAAQNSKVKRKLTDLIGFVATTATSPTRCSE